MIVLNIKQMIFINDCGKRFEKSKDLSGDTENGSVTTNSNIGG
jgi:hypothetical protein